MSLHAPSPLSGANVLAVIMGGGQGSRLYPLTQLRAKPAVPLGAKYRLVDIPISNCINSEIRRIYILTQFNSASLHRHILETYRFDQFSRGFIEILAAQQTLESMCWYQGTADAVRQNLRYFSDNRPDYILILSGDQLYRMDFRQLIRQHVGTFADITVAVVPVPRSSASGLGILQTDDEKRIIRFVEKPKEDAVLDRLKVTGPLLSDLRITGSKEDHYLASMGIYIFNRNVLTDVLNNDRMDFGRDIIPATIQTHRVFSFIHQGYWEDIGTIGAFFNANLDITNPKPRFNFFDSTAPIYTRARYLPPSRIANAEVRKSVVSDGCVIGEKVQLVNSVVGVRGVVQAETRLEECFVMGNDFYEDSIMANDNQARGLPNLGIGKGCRIRRTIIDKNCQIGDGCVISPEGKPENTDHPPYCIRDGIVVIPKNTIIPAGTTI
jgi:glucose-1-phosphate adenylyltransferase